eukprot:3940361-Rhodomonas_salina.1
MKSNTMLAPQASPYSLLLFLLSTLGPLACYLSLDTPTLRLQLSLGTPIQLHPPSAQPFS